MAKNNRHKLFKKLKTNLPYLFPVIFATIFFYKLFFPLSFFSTPGDILYFNYPLKEILSQSLKSDQLPLWSSQIGTGFPVLADGPIGAFYLPNLILFFLFPTLLAFNTSYIFIFLTAFYGTYFLCRLYGTSKIASLYAGLAFSFSGFFIARIIHTSFIQVASFLPLTIYIIEKFLILREKKYLLILSVLISQMIFAGYPQGVTYCIFIQLIYLILRTYTLNTKKSKLIKNIVLFLGAILISLVLSAAQILPSYELLKLSVRSGGLDSSQLFINSGSPKMLLLFFNPFAFGNLINDSYKETGIGFYWENIAYSGLLTPILALIAMFAVKGKNRRIIIPFTFITAISLLLSLGKYSPLHIIFDFPPFNFFRIPARFLFVTSFSISILSAFTISSLISNIKLRKLGIALPMLALIFISIDIFGHWFQFNSYTEVKSFKDKTISAILFSKNIDKTHRISSLWPYLPPATSDHSWGKNNRQYVSNTINLGPDSNVLFNIASADYYTSLSTRRLNLMRDLLRETIKIKDKKNSTIKNNGIKLFKLQSVEYLISTFNLEGESIEKSSANYSPDDNIKVFKINDTFSRIRMVKEYEVVKTLNALKEKLTDDTFDFESKVILEKTPPRLNSKFSNYKVTDFIDKQNSLNFKVTADGDGYLILADSYYPGWIAKVNGKKTEIYAANGNARAIYLEKGTNKVDFIYSPKSFLYGFLISISSYLFIILFLFSSFRKKLKFIQ